MNEKLNVMTMTLEQLIDSIQSKSLKICVIGIGRIGLPTALSFANSGLPTIGVDINKTLVNQINSKDFPLKDEPGYSDIFDKVTKNGKFYATTKIDEAVPSSDVIILSLPTPMDNTNSPDYTALKTIGKQLNKLLSLGSLVIVESTVEPGFVENELIKMIEGDDQTIIAGKDFGLGVCPETANPGQILNDFKKLSRLVGAIDENTSNIIMKIYRHVFTVDFIKMSNCKTANAVKLTTNVFRDINIAFVNELAIIFEKLGIDIMEVLDAAKTKYNFQTHYPGAGVGGPCIPVNSYQLISTANRLGPDFLKIVKTSRKINESMPDHVIELLIDAFKEIGKNIENSNILVLGISYKPDIKDPQLTPAEPLIEKLKAMKTNVKIFDPYFKNTKIFGIQTESDFVNSFSNSDALIIVTAHKEFNNLEPSFLKSKMRTPLVIDSRCILNQYDAKKAGLIYRGIGRGKI